MIFHKLFLCFIIFSLNFYQIYGVKEEKENGSDKEIFEEIWQNNSQNEKKIERKSIVKDELCEEKPKIGEKSQDFLTKIKREQLEENKLIMESQAKRIKSEICEEKGKIQKNLEKNLIKNEEEKEEADGFDQKQENQLQNLQKNKQKIILEKRKNVKMKKNKKENSNCDGRRDKLRVIREFDKMIRERKLENDYQRENRYKIEKEIAKTLGTYPSKIYQWKRENVPIKRSNALNDEEKLRIIGKFDKKKKKCRKNRIDETEKIEEKIGREMGKCPTEIAKWKRKLSQKKGNEDKAKLKIVNEFERRKRNAKKKKDNEIEQKVAKELGVCRTRIYKWKSEFVRHGQTEREESRNWGKFEQVELGKNRPRKWETEKSKLKTIKAFDKILKEYIRKLKNAYKSKNRTKMEVEIANKLGTYRNKIYQWKRELDTIEKFERIKKEFSKKFNEKPNKKNEEKIAEKIGVCLETIYNWKRQFDDDEQ